MIFMLQSRIGQIQAEEAAIGELLARIRGEELSAKQKSILAQLAEHHERLKQEAGFIRIG